MYKSLHIKNFRLFRDFKIESLGRVNLIGGRNNSGKTSLLEAIFSLNGPAEPKLYLTLAGGRGLEVFTGSSTATIWETIFTDFDHQQDIEIEGTTNNDSFRLIIRSVATKETESVQVLANDIAPNVATSEREQRRNIEYAYTRKNENRPYKTLAYIVNGELQIDAIDIPNLRTAVITFSRSKPSPEIDADRFSKASKVKLESELVRGLQIIEPNLTDIRLITELKAHSVLYGDIGKDRLFPLALMGDGLGRLLSMLLNIIYAAPDGIVLLDEIENGFHYKTMPKVWKALDEFSLKHNVQIFATTHSYECIMAAKEAFDGSELGAFTYHRLDKLKNGDIEAVTYDDEALEGASEFHMEVR